MAETDEEFEILEPLPDEPVENRIMSGEEEPQLVSRDAGLVGGDGAAEIASGLRRI